MLKTIVRVRYDAYMINTLMYYKLLLVIFFYEKRYFLYTPIEANLHDHRHVQKNCSL